MMLDHYQQTKNLLVSYSSDAQGLLLMDQPPEVSDVAAGHRDTFERVDGLHPPQPG